MILIWAILQNSIVRVLPDIYFIPGFSVPDQTKMKSQFAMQKNVFSIFNSVVGWLSIKENCCPGFSCQTSTINLSKLPTAISVG